MKIFIGSDHRGVELKNQIIAKLKEAYMEVEDTKLQNNESDDYPDFAFEVGENVINNNDSIGILICGNGIGISIAANKVKGIRCARVLNEDDAYKSRSHNGANIIALSAEIDINENLKIIKTFINTEQAKEERHIKRIEKIIKYEQGKYNEL